MAEFQDLYAAWVTSHRTILMKVQRHRRSACVDDWTEADNADGNQGVGDFHHADASTGSQNTPGSLGPARIHAMP